MEDTVNGFLRAAESSRSVGQVINIGSGREISMGELVEKILSLMGKTAEVFKDDRRVRPEKSEVERLICDNSKAKELLAWEPRISLEDGLKRTIAWFEKNREKYRTTHAV